MKYTILISLSFVALLLFCCRKEEEPKNDNKVVLRDKMEIDQIVGIATIS